jgi:hypothetical protein
MYETSVYLDACPLISENFGPLVFLGIYDKRNLPYMMECILYYMDSPAKSSTTMIQSFHIHIQCFIDAYYC